MATEIKIRGQKPIILRGYVWAAAEAQVETSQIIKALGKFKVFNLSQDCEVVHGTEIFGADGKTLYELEPGQSVTGEVLALQLIEYIKCLPVVAVQ